LEYLGVAAVFDVVVAEDDLQGRRLLHRHWYSEWIKGGCFVRARSAWCLAVAQGFAEIESLRGSMIYSGRLSDRAIRTAAVFVRPPAAYCPCRARAVVSQALGDCFSW
jgi:hypothetical protein